MGNADRPVGYKEGAVYFAGTAGAMDGAIAGRPRQFKILWIASGESMAATILIRPLRRGQARKSNANTRAMRVAHG